MADVRPYKRPNPDLALPADLSPLAAQAARAIVSLADSEWFNYTGGCRAFYSPQEWAARKERFGTDAVLVVVYDGSQLRHFFDYAPAYFDLIEKVDKALKELGLYAQPCTHWYTALYEVKP